MGLRPAQIVDAVGSVERGAFRDGGTELEDVDAAVAEDAEVLGGGDGELVLVERAEFDGVAVERGLKDRHVAAGIGVLLVVGLVLSRGA